MNRFVANHYIIASFCAFWVPIGQLFQPQWVFKDALKVYISTLLNQKHRKSRKSRIVTDLSRTFTAHIIDQLCWAWTIGHQKLVNYICTYQVERFILMVSTVSNTDLSTIHYYHTGSTICSETLYFVDCESADWRSEKILGSNERYIY